MRPTHDHDCAIHRSPICDCGALLKCSRTDAVPGWKEHCEAIKAITQAIAPVLEHTLPEVHCFASGTDQEHHGQEHSDSNMIEIMINGHKVPCYTKDGIAYITYEDVVRRAIELRAAELRSMPPPEKLPLDKLPHLTVTYNHHVSFANLPGERSGMLWPGRSVPVTAGMSISAVDTSHA